ncbi:protein farnesyltransferase/ geranylgeranyltransferase type-1 subunit alpha [Marchantia polymorpha subsp. ruderalis]|uniref:Protein farnesyltransferase/geranylgeranyltransferase type-1 subunit alpha n=2 Tax=Marchantia polymorpha TaxID=3197 RepID=A0A176VE17_MARPO|nr:hypothetical protein AXG93_2396s1240 [Marchantia polymorpha subsp. ruderalis]PTQ32972.1 hypothetical protein MARPO_0093s0047 [Marchantia polymorpha]BBN11361.1 hypothetical protein Mp_5g11240 [Marchantia polymorpha subsp. ruderalis]|eukprot:PTQ32972.1 hypothetical protein MARPO_0093s0047 [Marchantia polymorpha]
MARDNWVPFNERPEWEDLEPVPQDDGPNPVVPISYTRQFRETMDYFRAILKKDERSVRALKLTAEVVGLNSANYTVWHFRRLVLEELGSDLEEELSFMEEIADLNFKNYQFWQHRRWVAEKRGAVAVRDELKYTEIVLQDDAKNYHAWSHRQWVLLNLGGWDGELDYCSKLLSQDIYNNSAWNQRYFVITKDPSRGGLKSMLEPEVSYTLMAIQEAPTNESSWRYLRGLFKDDKATFITRSDVIMVCLQQLADEQSCVHALNLLLDLLSIGYEPSQTDCSALGKALGTWSSLVELAGLLCTRLEELDSIRSRYWAWRRTMLPTVASS